MMMRRRGRPLVRAAATTAVVAGTAGAVRHHQNEKYSRQAAEQQAGHWARLADAKQISLPARFEPSIRARVVAHMIRRLGPRRMLPVLAEYEQAEYEQQAAMPQEAAPAAAPASGGIDMDELKKLGDLHASGVLTDEEFAAAKAKVLGT